MRARAKTPVTITIRVVLNHNIGRGGAVGEARRRGLDLMSIMVEADPRFPDARAAATLIENLNNLLPSINLPHQPLIEEAEFLESQLQAMMDGANISKDSQPSNSMLYG